MLSVNSASARNSASRTIAAKRCMNLRLVYLDYASRLSGVGECEFRAGSCCRRCLASVNKHWALGLGKGDDVTNRLGSVIMVTIRSRPKASPPWGGAPYLSASRRKPNLSCASSSPMPSALNTCSCTSARWIRTDPPPSPPAVERQIVGFGQALAGPVERSGRCSSFGLVNG